MNAASLVKHYIKIVEKLTSELDRWTTVKPDNITKQFNALQKSWLTLAKLTNNGKGPTELRTEKLKALKKWLSAYANKEEFLQNTIPQRYKNKTVVVDNSILDTYQEYANLAIIFMTEMPIKYQEIKDKVLPLLAMRKELFKHLDDFELEESDLLAVAAIETEVEGMIHTPQKTINSIRAILRNYAKFIKSVQIVEAEIEELLAYFEGTTLEVIYNRLNHRNRLLKSLVSNLSNIKKTIEEANFQHKLAIIKEYQVILEGMSQYLPDNVIHKLSLAKLTSPIQEELERSPKYVKRYDPLKDPEMVWPEPVTPKEEEKSKETIEKRVDRLVRNYELADEAKELAQRPGKPLSPEEKKKYQELWNREGVPVSPEDKQKYEALWEREASLKLKKLIRLAKHLEIKYN